MSTGSGAVPVRRIITVTDAEEHGRRRNDDQRDLQNRMAEVENRAALNAGLSLDGSIIQGRGDGRLIAWPPGTSELDLITNYLRELHRELERLNGALNKSSRIRMRLAVATGLVEEAAQGIPGQGVIKATILADSAALKEALRKARGQSLVVLLDDGLFHEVVETGLRGLRPEQYEKVVIPDKYGQHHTAWISVPGARRPRAAAARVDPPGGDPGSRRADQPDPGREKRRRKVPLPITVALIGAAGAIAAAAITAEAEGGPSKAPSTNQSATMAATHSPVPTSPSTPTRTPSATRSASPSVSPGELYEELTDNRLNTSVYSDPMGDAVASGPGYIPFHTQVMVKCWAPNESGMGSINVFYLVETPPWAGEYAPADTFLNGDTAGTLDPLVPKCKT